MGAIRRNRRSSSSRARWEPSHIRPTRRKNVVSPRPTKTRKEAHLFAIASSCNLFFASKTPGILPSFFAPSSCTTPYPSHATTPTTSLANLILHCSPAFNALASTSAFTPLFTLCLSLNAIGITILFVLCLMF